MLEYLKDSNIFGSDTLETCKISISIDEL